MAFFNFEENFDCSNNLNNIKASLCENIPGFIFSAFFFGGEKGQGGIRGRSKFNLTAGSTNTYLRGCYLCNPLLGS